MARAKGSASEVEAVELAGAQSKHTGGKLPADIKLAEFERLVQLQCTVEEAASFFKCAKRTLQRYLKQPEYAEAWERGRELGKLSLRRLQWRHANGTGSSAVQMTIHLSKHWLGETEKVLNEITGKDGAPIEVSNVRARIRSQLARLAPEGAAGQNPGEPKR